MSIRLIISDFDGVLLDLKSIHFESLNKALQSVDEKYVISTEEHIKIYDGLSTRKKLLLLSQNKGLPNDSKIFDNINELKQQYTLELLKDFKLINHTIKYIIETLKNEGYLFYVASNAIKNTVLEGLRKLDIENLVDCILANEEVEHQKPHSQIYLKCMVHAGVNPDETLIIEDSKHGREAAVKSGAFICGVDNSFNFTYDKIKEAIKNTNTRKIKWSGKDVVVLVPMAGAGKRFFDAGYLLPKPLINVNGKPMIQHVVENLNIDAHYVFIVKQEHLEKYNLQNYLNLIVPGCTIITTDGIIRGAAYDTLRAKEYINNDKHLIIANSDQFVEWDSCDFMYNMISSEADGGILTFKASETKWSYAKCDELGKVIEVAEKKVISDTATVGVYFWKHGQDYVQSAEQMIAKDIKTNNEFYVCPTFNEAIQNGKNIKIYPVDKMWGLGTPEDLSYFLANYGK